MSRRLGVVIALVLATAAPASAQPPDTVWLEELTWTEVRDLVKAGTTTIIIPVGGVEQSGPAMALGKHDVRAKALAEMIARKVGKTLIAPVVAYVPEGAISPPTQHMRFAGTITIPSDVFRKTVESAALGFASHGFRDVILIGDHGGYQGDLAAVAGTLNRKWGSASARAHYVPEYYRAATTEFYPVLRSHGYSSAEAGTHAGAADTSLMMAIDPRLVREEALRTGAGLEAANGVYGDPRRSSAAMGKLAVDAIVEKATAAIQAAVAKR